MSYSAPTTLFKVPLPKVSAAPAIWVIVPALVSVPPRFTVPVVATIVVALVQVPLRLSVPPAT